MKVVVAGAGQAAAAFAAKLRELSADAEISVFGDEPVLPYQRPPLSKKYMTGEFTRDRLLLRPDEWYEAQRIDCRPRTTVTAIDAEGKTVQTSRGETFCWDKLLIATGATPRRLPAEIGGDLDGVYVLRSLADADAMTSEFNKGRRVLVVGGGYIGLEAASVAASLGLQVHVAEMADRILKRVAAPQTSDYFRDLHASHGVSIMERVSLERIEGGNGQARRAVFADGQALEVDFVLVGIGVTPNDQLARDAGLAVDNGIVADYATRTSHPDIHAAGDCASFTYRGEHVRLESVQNAIDQGEAAARAVAGEDIEYKPVPWFWSDQYDVKLQIAGLHAGYDETAVRPGAREGSQSVWYFANREFIAVDAMNDPRAYMLGKRMLEAGKNLLPEQACDPGFDLKAHLG